MKIASLVSLLMAAAPAIAAQSVPAAVPGVDVWISGPLTALAHDAPVSAHAVADPQAYVVVFRVTSDSRIIVIAPRTPYGAYRVPKVGLRSAGVDVSFRTEQTDGVGYLFAAASYTPFDFSRVRSGRTWDTDRLGSPPHKGAIDVADWFVQQIVPSRNTPYGVNDVAYYVGVTPPADSEKSARQNVSDDAQPSGSQSTVLYMTQGYYDPLYYNQYGYNPYAYLGGTYPYILWYGNNFYWHHPHANGRGSGFVKRCPDGSTVPVWVACPVVLIGGRSRGMPHRMVPRKPTPPHLIAPVPRRPPPVTQQLQPLPPAPLLSPSMLNRRPAPHNDRPAAPRPAPVGIYNRPIIHPAPAPRPTQSAPPTASTPQQPTQSAPLTAPASRPNQPAPPSHAGSQEPSRRR